jgi:GAF domain-containing protein
MKAVGHKLAVASQSIIGQVTSVGEVLVVNDVTQDVNYYPNPLLPDTRSELAVPLKAGDQILGALDVQSIKVNAFSEESISTLRILADQLAVAVYNANLFAKTEETLGQHRLLHQITTEAASKENVEDVLISTVQALHSAQFGERVAFYILDDQKKIDLGASAGYRNEELLNVNIAVSRGIIKTVFHENRHIRINDLLSEPDFYSLSESTRAQLAVPITYTNNLLGILIVESSTLAAFDEEDQEILATLGNNLGAIIFSVNLLGRVRRQVERQRVLYEITSKIRRAVDVPTVLQTSANEIGRVLNANRARIEITIGKTPQDTPHENGGNGKSKEVSQ